MRARSLEDVQTRRSEMSHDLDHLIELQQLETAAEGARRLVAATPQRIAGLDAQLAAADAALATAREQKVQSETERSHAEASLAEIAHQRQAILPKISPQAYAIFDTVSRGRKSPAVAAVVGGLCSVCHVRIRPQIDQDVRRREQIVQCESCTRILYHPALHPAVGTPPA